MGSKELLSEAYRVAVEKYFDWDIYNTVTKKCEEELKAKANEVKAQSLDSLKKLLGGSS